MMPAAVDQVVTMAVMVPISYGELVDKITILEIKADQVADPGQRANIERELALLAARCQESLPAGGQLAALKAALSSVNRRLWAIEDAIRAKERAQAFDAEFVALARSVYQENDERARLKRQINLEFDSALVEEKLYAAY
jgi:hypothetical protein